MKTASIVAGAFVLAASMQSVPRDASLSADLACETARMLVYQAATPIKPTTDSCENCSGLGRLGDGRVSTICPICKGTGKKPKAACVNGRCPL
jgi:DnaJ-class molecular chaperone